MKYNDKAGEDCFYVGKAVMQKMLTAAKEGNILITPTVQAEETTAFMWEGYEFKLNNLLREHEMHAVGPICGKILKQMRDIFKSNNQEGKCNEQP